MSYATEQRFTLEHIGAAPIRFLINSGMSCPAVGARYGVTQAAVWYFCQRHGISTRPPSKFWRRVTREQIEAMVERGLSDRQIAQKYGVTAAAVCFYRFKKCIPSPRAVRGWAVE